MAKEVSDWQPKKGRGLGITSQSSFVVLLKKSTVQTVCIQTMLAIR